MNNNSFARLYEAHHSRLIESMTMSVQNVAEAEEISAKAFAIAFEKRETFRGDSSFYTWIYAIARNEIRMKRRFISTISLDNTNEREWAGTASEDIQSELERSESCIKIRRLLKKLPIPYRRALLLRYFKLRTIREISEYEGVPIGTVLSRLHAGKCRLRQLWNGKKVKEG